MSKLLPGRLSILKTLDRDELQRWEQVWGTLCLSKGAAQPLLCPTCSPNPVALPLQRLSCTDGVWVGVVVLCPACFLPPPSPTTSVRAPALPACRPRCRRSTP